MVWPLAYLLDRSTWRHGGSTTACRNGAINLLAGSQIGAQTYLERNAERRITINFIELIQVEGNTPIRQHSLMAQQPDIASIKLFTVKVTELCARENVSAVVCW